MEPVASSRCPSQRDKARATARAFLFRVPANNLRSQVVSSSAGRSARIPGPPRDNHKGAGRRPQVIAFDNCFILL